MSEDYLYETPFIGMSFDERMTWARTLIEIRALPEVREQDGGEEG